MMKGLWLENQQLTLRHDLPIPEPSAHEVLVKVRMAGICATDQSLVKGYYPFTGIPGHEFVGEIVSAPDATFLPGQRVVGEINIVCGQCHACRHNLSKHCEQRRVLGILNANGVFAEYVCLPLSNIHPIPDHVKDENAVFVEPLAAAMDVLEQISLQSETKILVIGAGKLGLLIAQCLSLINGDLTVVARYDKQKRLLQAHHIKWIAETEIQNKAYDVAVEVTGSAGGLTVAINAVKANGLIILKSTLKENVSLNMSRIVVDELQLKGSRCGSFSQAIEAIKNGNIKPKILIDHVSTLDDGIAAMQLASESGVMKVVLDLR